MGCVTSKPEADAVSARGNGVRPNEALAKETFEMQVQMAVGTVSPEMIQSFFSKFAGYFADKIDLIDNDGSKVKLIGATLGEVMQTVGTIWMGAKNSKCVNVSIKALDASRVEVKQEYTHVFVDADDEEVPSTATVMPVTHTLTYKDGKINAWVQTYDAAVLADNRAKVMEAEFAKNMPAWGAAMAAWGEGKFSGDSKMETAKQFWSDDIVVDATYPLVNTAGYAKYEGLEAALKYIDFLTEIDMPDFNVTHTCAGPDGSVVAFFEMTPTVKATGKTGAKITLVQQAWYKKGKMARVYFYSSPDNAAMDALFDAKAEVPPAPAAKPVADTDFAANMGVWAAGMAAWGAGKFNGPDAAAAAAELWTKDFTVNASYPMKNTDGWRKYSGIQDSLKFMDYLALIDMPDFAVKHVCPGPANTVIAYCTYTPTIKATGKQGKTQGFWQQVTVKDGKLADLTFFQDPQFGSMDALFAA